MADKTTGDGLPTKADYPFSYPFRVRYAEIDGQGIVFNAHYLTYFDVAITEYFHWLPYPYGLGGIPGSDDDFHIVKTVVEYYAPLRFEENIRVHVRTGRMGRSSLSFELAIFPEDADDLRATGEVIWVNTNQSTMTSTPLPEDLVEVIKSREPGRFDDR